MLDAGPIADAIVAALRSIPDLVAAMTGAPEAIEAFHYLYGADHPLREHVYQITPPGIVIAWKGTQSDATDGQTLYTHRFDVYIRSGSVALDPSTAGPSKLWKLICNGVTASGQNILQANLLPELDLIRPPSVGLQQDEDQMDVFVGTLVIPEIGDN